MLIYILFLHQFIFVQMLKFQKPVAEKVWSVRCKTHEYVLNDCNWCWCGQDHHFKCKARVCEEVDMFGHFKDTIQELDLGMEGHGSWRSRLSSCTPGVQYKRGTILCVCDEDGNWPNPVCRDLFRILHSIEVTENVEESTSQTCSPTKLYLVGCNACFCPSSGKLDANLCTNRTCSDDDPVLEPKEADVLANPKNTQVKHEVESELVDDDTDRKNPLDKETTDLVDAESNDLTQVEEGIIRKSERELEIYAPCNHKKTYAIGGQDCKCLANNRLLCDKTTEESKKVQGRDISIKSTLCKGRIGRVIKLKCNHCKCTSDSYMYCTTKKCLPRSRDKTLSLIKIPIFGKPVPAPIDDVECVPGTTYTRGCNLCFCGSFKRIKVFICWIRPCRKPKINDMVNDCVTGTTYETDCLICTCDDKNNKKYRACKISPKCSKSLLLKETHSKGLDALHGYCEPLHVYAIGCNTCRCLSDGKLLRCTTRLCSERSSQPLDVEIVPYQQAESEPCPTAHSYKVGCNLCFCLSNGNALCTTADCSKAI